MLKCTSMTDIAIFSDLTAEFLVSLRIFQGALAVSSLTRTPRLDLPQQCDWSRRGLRDELPPPFSSCEKLLSCVKGAGGEHEQIFNSIYTV